MKSSLPRWLIAVVYGGIAGLTALGLAVGPEGTWADFWSHVTPNEVIGVLIAFLTAAWGKYSNPEKMLDPTPTKTLRR